MERPRNAISLLLAHQHQNSRLSDENERLMAEIEEHKHNFMALRAEFSAMVAAHARNPDERLDTAREERDISNRLWVMEQQKNAELRQQIDDLNRKIEQLKDEPNGMACPHVRQMKVICENCMNR